MIAEKPSNRPELCGHRAITQLSGLGKIVNEITRLWRRHHLSYDQPNMWSSKPGVTWPCSRPIWNLPRRSLIGGSNRSKTLQRKVGCKNAYLRRLKDIFLIAIGSIFWSMSYSASIRDGKL